MRVPGEQLQRSFLCTFQAKRELCAQRVLGRAAHAPRLSGAGRHFRRAAARAREGSAASASGENGNFEGQKRN